MNGALSKVMVSWESEGALLAETLGLPASRGLELARVLEEIGGLHVLQSAGSRAFDAVLEPDLRARLDGVLKLMRAVTAPRDLPPSIEGAATVASYFAPRLANELVETFWVLMLDSRARAIAVRRVSEGTLTSCLVHPREVFAPAIAARAASIVCVHNHPSGDPHPSAEDLSLTERLTSAGEIVGIPLLDHVVIARSGYRSIGGRIERPRRAHGRINPG